ncbi:hypothetical protein LXA43DRAFT_496371 [Ganoderma leucocontextum]|nr:hypothetical protein LXA43DRAFT_496371 [Ganoderma leucocontextum]
MKRLRRVLIGNRGAPLVHVNWNSRTAAFDNNSTEAIIRKACAHFRLGPVEHEYVLVTSTSDGGRIEVTDDLLKRLPDGSWLDFVRISAFERFDDEQENRLLEKPQPPLSQTKRLDTPPSTANSSTRYNPSPETVQVPPPQPRPSQHTRPTPSQRKPRPQPVRRSPSPPLYPPSEPSISTSPYAPTEVPSRPSTPSDGSTYAIPRHAPRAVRKPVVYLFPPQALPEVAITIHLVPQWSFTHIYPLVDPKREEDGRQAITWTVSASPDGTLVEKHTGLELSYLFWEAAAHRAAPPSPPLSLAGSNAVAPSHDHDHFDPAYPLLDPCSPTAVLLPFDELLPYLDGVLKALTLHTAARNDFITYWLPLLAKQPFVALRFLPQPVYERAAGLVVRPAPDVITRVMMLFRGVPAADADVWSAARNRVGQVDWAAVVGVEPEAADERRFRVLEWGAIEVL